MKQAVCGILFDSSREKVLLIKRRDIPVWVLPGGGIEPGESAEQAIVREIQEESGYTVKIQRKIAEYLPVNAFTQFTHFFECAILSSGAFSENETKEMRFFPLNDLPSYLAPPYRGWIDDAVAQHPHLLRKKIAGVSYWVFLKLLLLHPCCVFRYLLTRIGIHLNS